MFEFIERNKIPLILAMLLMQFISLSLDTYSLYDRRMIRRDFQLNRQMLDARARIQIIVIERNWEKFSEEEKRFIRENWNAAEYDTALPLK